METVSTDQVDRQPVAQRLTVKQGQIVSSAASLFHQFGYDNVTLDLIAGNLGMRGPAIYRHFEGKQAILRAVIDSSFVEVEAVVAEATSDDSPRQAARHMVEGMVDIGLRHREFGVMWQREARHLAGDSVTHFRSRFLEASRRIARVLGRAHPELRDQDLDLLAWAALSITSSASHHTHTLPPKRLHRTVLTMVSSVCLAEDTAGGSGGAETRTDLVHSKPTAAKHVAEPEAFVNRREQILLAASRLFADLGFQAVTMSEIGQAAGLAGPSIYNHFENKVDILIAAFLRATDLLEAGTRRAQSGSDPELQLDMTIASYVDLAFEHSHLVSMLVTEVRPLPEAERRHVERLMADFDEQWVDLLVAINPALKRTVARFVVRAVHTLVNDVVRIPHLRRRVGAKEALEQLARTVALSVSV